jgi:hypothetical protein
MVGEDNDFVLCSFEVMTPGFKGSNDGEEFFIIDFIISFGVVHSG